MKQNKPNSKGPFGRRWQQKIKWLILRDGGAAPLIDNNQKNPLLLEDFTIQEWYETLEKLETSR